MGEQQRDAAELRDEGTRDMIPKRASEESLGGRSLQTSLQSEGKAALGTAASCSTRPNFFIG